jgi:hypothetical protein
MVLALSALFVIVAGPASPSRAEDDDKAWVKLGEMKVARDVDKDEIYVATKAWYSKIRFRVHGPKIKLYRIQIHFGNAEKQDIQLNQEIAGGDGTGPIDLEGKNRHITSITVWYKTIGEHKSGEASVSLWGLKQQG